MAVTHVFVRALPDKTVPLMEGGRLRLLVEKDEEGVDNVYRVPWTTETRKRINAGDMRLSDRAGNEVPELAAASAPDEVPLNENGSVADPPVVAGPAVKAFDTSDTTKGR